MQGKTIPFTKMQGCGNDYIYVDTFLNPIDNPEEVAIRLSDRHFGIGGDGLVLITPSKVADAGMRMFNADGSEGKMCGNAIRCVGKYLYDRKGWKKDELTVETLSGIKRLSLCVQDGQVTRVQVNMGEAHLDPADIPVVLEGDRIVNHPLPVGDTVYGITCVSMGNPHCVIFCDNVDDLNLPALGPAFEHHPLFPERVNTEFVRLIDHSTLSMRVWERGSGETMACGTGACASVVAAVLNGYCAADTWVTVKLLGGELSVRYRHNGAVDMLGAAAFAFDGTVEI